jgi:next-to-BRCA1 protein 1
MQKTVTKIIVFALALILLGTFGVQSASQTPQVDVSQTALINTMVAGYFETQTASAPLATPTLSPSSTPPPTSTIVFSVVTFPPPPAQGINTIAPTIVLPSPVVLSTVAGSSAAVTGSSCYNLTFLRDLSIPPKTVLSSRQNFIKEWRVQNTGTCAWDYNFSMMLVGGDAMDVGPTLFRKRVEPNETAVITLDMDAPKKTGTYTGYWRMSDGTNPFGDTLVVSIVVP